MRFTELRLKDVFLVELEGISDHRGFFARSYCRRDFTEHGLEMPVVQCSISFNDRAGTLRGLHYQAEPFTEAKLVRCTMGAIYDVVVDLRPESPTYRQWVAIELSADNRQTLFVPTHCAHGFKTLRDNTEVFYQMSEFYHADAARGIRWNDPALRIDWPLGDPILSERDRSYQDLLK